MVEIRIKRNIYRFQLYKSNILKLFSLYDYDLPGYIERITKEEDVAKMMKLIKQIINEAYIGVKAAWPDDYPPETNDAYDVVDDLNEICNYFILNCSDLDTFFKNIMPDHEDHIERFELKRYPNGIYLSEGPVKSRLVNDEPIRTSDFICRCFPLGTPCHSERYPWPAVVNNNKEEKDMPIFKNYVDVQITKIVTHNNKVVIVYFSDGSFTKAICSDNDTFDLDVGIQVCFLKKILGTARYFKTMKYAHELIEAQEQEKKDRIEEKRMRREEQKKREMKNRKFHEDCIKQWKNDITDAVKAALNAKEDDLK